MSPALSRELLDLKEFSTPANFLLVHIHSRRVDIFAPKSGDSPLTGDHGLRHSMFFISGACLEDAAR